MAKSKITFLNNGYVTLSAEVVAQIQALPAGAICEMSFGYAGKSLGHVVKTSMATAEQADHLVGDGTYAPKPISVRGWPYEAKPASDK